eukprot:m.236224 g.236224  ORF g.236224 m.236224 type:complete len:172 (+) comp45716_c0_seq1:305-820(+)
MSGQDACPTHVLNTMYGGMNDVTGEMNFPELEDAFDNYLPLRHYEELIPPDCFARYTEHVLSEACPYLIEAATRARAGTLPAATTRSDVNSEAVEPNPDPDPHPHPARRPTVGIVSHAVYVSSIALAITTALGLGEDAVSLIRDTNVGEVSGFHVSTSPRGVTYVGEVLSS